MKRQVVAALGLSMLFVAGLAVFKYLQIVAAIAEGKNQGPPPEAVTSFVVVEELWENTRKAVGSVKAVEGALLSAEENGRVAEIHFESGQSVEKGAVLVSLDSAVEQAQLDAALARLKLAGIDARRQKTLRKKEANSQADLDNAQATFSEANAEVKRLEAVIARRSVIAPFSGVTGIRKVNVGQMVSVGDPVVSLQSFEALFVDFYLPQKDLNGLAPGMGVRIRLEGREGEIAGEVEAIEAEIDVDTRNVLLRAKVSNVARVLRPGMFVEAEVNLGQSEQLLTVPASSILHAPYGDAVYILTPSESKETSLRVVKPITVITGRKRGDQIAIISGLKAGEEIVSSGVFKLRPGSMVSVNNEVQPDNLAAPETSDT